MIESVRENKSPKLRFSKFKEPWAHLKLSEFMQESKKRNSDLTYKKENVLSVSGKQGIVNQIEHLGRSYAGVSVHNYHIVDVGDIVYTKSPLKEYPYGIIKVNKKEPGIVSTLYAVYKVDSDIALGPFLDCYFSLDEHTNKYLRPLVKKGAKNDMKINNSYVLHDKIFVPGINEQKKLVTFFDCIDQWIASLQNQQELLMNYKKGVIEKVITKKIRFKDAQNKEFPEWKQVSLGEILRERKEYSTKGKGYTHLSLTTNGVVLKSERYDRDFLVDNDETKGYKITRKNDLCYNPANLKFGVISVNKLGPGIFSPIYVTFEIIEQNIDFLGYYLTRTDFINKARRYEQGTVYERMAVNPEDFLTIKVELPSRKEQDKIASFINVIDDTINLKAKQIQLAEEWKKGLMQEMFI